MQSKTMTKLNLQSDRDFSPIPNWYAEKSLLIVNMVSQS